MGFLNTIAACYYSFNQSLMLQAEICFDGQNKYLDICGYEDFKQAPISQVAKTLESTGNKIIINPHEPLKSELNVDYRVSEINLDLENVQQYEDLLASLNYEGKIKNTCNVTYDKPHKKNSLFLLLQGSIELLKPSYLERFNRKVYQNYTFLMLSAMNNE